MFLEEHFNEEGYSCISSLWGISTNVPLTVAYKTARLTQKYCESSLTATKAFLAQLDSYNRSGNLSDIIGDLEKLQKKFESMAKLIEKETPILSNLLDVTQERLAKMDTATNNLLKNRDFQSMESLSEPHINRLILDYLLRSGCYESAIMFSKDFNLNGELDQIFLEAMRPIDNLLQSGDLERCIAWCDENKSSKSDLLYKLRRQELIQLMLKGQYTVAVEYVKKHLKDNLVKEMADIKNLLAIIISPRGKQSQELITKADWGSLAESFRSDFVNSLSGLTVSPFLVAAECGISAFKTPLCFPGISKSCPHCDADIFSVGISLPFAEYNFSRLRCPYEGENIDDKNVPYVLPNGHVYGINALKKIASLNDGRIVCVFTGMEFKFKEAVRIFAT